MLLHRYMLTNMDVGDTGYDIMIVDKQIMPFGTWLVIRVFTNPGDNDLYRLRLLWRRNAKRKDYKPLQLKGPVVPVEPHKIDVSINDNWVIGVRHQQIYGFIVDTAYHDINLEEVDITTQVELITPLDFISLTS